jgi:hypothetical protein
VTDLEVDEAIREAWTILYAELTASPLARRLAAALLAVTGDTPTNLHWVTPDELWRDRLAVLAEQNAWLAALGPQPGEPPHTAADTPTRRWPSGLASTATRRDPDDGRNLTGQNRLGMGRVSERHLVTLATAVNSDNRPLLVPNHDDRFFRNWFGKGHN